MHSLLWLIPEGRAAELILQDKFLGIQVFAFEGQNMKFTCVHVPY